MAGEPEKRSYPPPPDSDAAEVPETIAVRPGEEMDWRRLIAHLRAHFDRLPGEVEVVQFAGGHANLTYLLRAGDRELVVRRPPLGPLAKGAHDMGREYRVLSKLYAGYARAPRAYYFCDDPSVLGASFLVVERRTGVVVRRRWPEALREVEHLERRVSVALVDALADLHLVDPGAVGLADLGRPHGFVARQLEGWAARWRAAKHRDIPAFERVHAELVRRMPESSRVSILHNDYKLDNCQLEPGEPDRIEAVFDWDMATLGDPLIDLSVFLNYWPSEDGIYSWDRMPPFVREPYPRRAALIARYAERTGFDVRHLDWYEAFARWKTAVVVQQIYIRFERGQTDDPRFATYGRYAEPLIESAGDLLSRRPRPL